MLAEVLVDVAMALEVEGVRSLNSRSVLIERLHRASLLHPYEYQRQENRHALIEQVRPSFLSPPYLASICSDQGCLIEEILLKLTPVVELMADSVELMSRAKAVLLDWYEKSPYLV